MFERVWVKKEALPPKNRWEGEFKVGTTEGWTERGLGANYFAHLSKSDRKSLGIRGQAVVVRTFDTGEEPRKPELRPPQMRARCQVARSPRWWQWRRRRKPQDPDPADGEVLLDQTLRNALGIKVDPDPDDEVEIYDLQRSPFRTRGERFCDWALRRRYLFMRVRKADPSDMEKRMVRIPRDSFSLLGINSGEKLRISHLTREGGAMVGPFKERRCSLQAYPVTQAIEERQETESEGGLYDRYPRSLRLLGVRPDLGSIYLDRSARKKLDVRTLEVVRVRRTDPDAFMQQIRSFGLATAAAAITVSGIFGFGESLQTGAIVLGIALFVAVVFSIFNLRTSSYGSPE